MEPAADHPSPNQLRAFDQGRLCRPDWSAVERHFHGCPRCRAALEELPDQTLNDLVRDYDPDRRAAWDTPDPAPSATPGPRPPAGDEPPRELAEHPRYRVLGLLGSGGMGTVFKAEHRLLNRPVALKVIHGRLLGRPGAVERFRREARTAARLAHPNVVAVHDAEQAGDVHFLVLEYVDGETLDRLVRRRGPLPVAEACDYVRQAALGLQHAHEQGMVHRDLKPANLIVTPAGRVKVLDFGLAQVVREYQAADGLTPEGALLGTPGYLAPEQARDPRAADIRADLYSLGCTLYHLLAGRPPFPADSLLQQLLDHQDRTPRPLAEVRPDVPPELARVVARLLAKEPGRRFPSPAALAAALEPFAAGERRQRAGRGRAGVPCLVLGGLAALLVVLGAGFFLWRGRPVPGEAPGTGRNADTPAGPAAAWADRPSARNQAVAWMREHNPTGPDHPLVADLGRVIDRDAQDGRAFQAKLGAGLVRSGKPTMLAGRYHDFVAFEFSDEQAIDWVRPQGFLFWVSTAPAEEVYPRPLVRLSPPRVEGAADLGLKADVAGTLPYERLGPVSGTLTLRLTCMPAGKTVTLFQAMPELTLTDAGRIAFNFGPLFGDLEPEGIAPGPTLFFLELGYRPESGAKVQLKRISNTVAVPVFYRVAR
jgi:hypothetical protein